jgi:hypothetical protein
MSGDEAMEHAHTPCHLPPAAAAPLPPHLFRAKPSCTTHRKQLAHIFPPAALARENTRHCSAAGHVTLGCVFIGAAAHALRRAEVWGAQAAPTRRHSTEAATMSCMPLASNPLFALLAT